MATTTFSDLTKRRHPSNGLPESRWLEPNNSPKLVLPFFKRMWRESSPTAGESEVLRIVGNLLLGALGAILALVLASDGGASAEPPIVRLQVIEVLVGDGGESSFEGNLHVQSDGPPQVLGADSYGKFNFYLPFSEPNIQVAVTLEQDGHECDFYLTLRDGSTWTRVAVAEDFSKCGELPDEDENAGGQAQIIEPVVQGFEDGNPFIELAWSSNYLVERTDIERNGVVIGETLGSSFVDNSEGVIEQPVTYRVRTSSMHGSVWSEPVTATFAPSRPAVPGQLQVLALGTIEEDRFVSLGWFEPLAAQAVEIERDGVVIAVDDNRAFRDVSSFVEGQIVTYRIRAVAGDRHRSEWSEPLTVLIPCEDGDCS